MNFEGKKVSKNMDYKNIVETLNWHALYSDLSGSEAKVVMYLATACNYKTGKISISYTKLAEAVQMSRPGVQKALAGLVKKKAIAVDSSACGRSETKYRVRDVEELNAYYAKEVNNPAADAHYDEETRLWGQLIIRHGSIGEDCPECEELPGEELCHRHTAMRKMLEDSQEWRDYKLWLADNPKPAQRIRQINGRTVVE